MILYNNTVDLHNYVVKMKKNKKIHLITTYKFAILNVLQNIKTLWISSKAER